MTTKNLLTSRLHALFPLMLGLLALNLVANFNVETAIDDLDLITQQWKR
jgi:hypothetical protein